MQYIQATVTTVSTFADTLSVLLIEYGSEGVSVVDHEDVKRVLSEHTWDYADASLYEGGEDGVAYVNGYYPADHDFAPLAEHLEKLRAQADEPTGSLELHLKVLDSADYENEWKKYYAPIELVSIVIMPEWMRYDGEKRPVYIDPGMAFGTGSHETTKLCLQYLEKENMQGVRCADIGCGSGILGATALVLGAQSCFMADIDPQAVEAAKRNCSRNNVADRAQITEGTLPEKCNEVFDIAVANITADVLAAIEKDVCRALRKGGRLIVSGIIHSRANDVTDAYEKDFTLLDRKKDGEWQAMLWEKK